MKLTIRNVPRKVINLKAIRNAALFFANEIFSPQLKKHLELLIWFDEKECGNAYGSVGYTEDLRDFNIYINPTKDKDGIIQTIAHEMVHVDQIATKRWFVFAKDNRTRWKNRVYKADVNSYDYHKPWENEAYKIEKELVTKLKDLIDTQPGTDKFSKKFINKLRKGS